MARKELSPFLVLPKQVKGRLNDLINHKEGDIQRQETYKDALAFLKDNECSADVIINITAALLKDKVIEHRKESIDQLDAANQRNKEISDSCRLVRHKLECMVKDLYNMQLSV